MQTCCRAVNILERWSLSWSTLALSLSIFLTVITKTQINSNIIDAPFFSKQNFPVIRIAPSVTGCASSSHVRVTQSDCGSLMEDEHRLTKKNQLSFGEDRATVLASKINTGEEWQWVSSTKLQVCGIYSSYLILIKPADPGGFAGWVFLVPTKTISS